MRKLLLLLFKRASRPFWGRGIYWKHPFISKVYNFAYRHLSAEGTVLFNIDGLKIYAKSKSSIAKFIEIKGSYEEETTKLFGEILQEGMIVLDLGANIGYFSLVAGRQVGEKGKVFAFEPWHESFSLLQKNIEANGFKNITPVAKAVSNRGGRQKLFLADDPGEHSLGEENSKKSVEVSVTTVDEFVRGQNISVDLVKMDVEGAEMSVLEGMAETISSNPHMKIITEFVAELIERNNCSSSVFLDKLMGFGFKLYVVDDDKHTRLLITPGNMNDLLNPLHGRLATCVNIYCDRDA
jgi:FkbM family methyltransferase